MYSGLENCCQSCQYQRYTIAILTGIGILICYVNRSCFSLALTVMVKKHEHTISSNYCPGGKKAEASSHEKGEFNWSDQLQGYLISSFFIGYIFTNVLGGIIADKFGGKHVIGVSAIGTAVGSWLTPVSARLSPYCLLVLRILMGILQGAMLPAMSAIAASWAPPNERTSISMIMNSGIAFGTCLGNAVTGVILSTLPPWDNVFYIFGSLGALWWMIWVVFGFSTPDDHLYITEDEKTYITDEIGVDSERVHGRTPWKDIILSIPFEVINLSSAGMDWGFYMISSELPLYLSNVLNFDVADSGLVSAAPWIAMWFGGMGSSILSDLLLRNNRASKLVLRRVLGGIGNIGAGTVILIASYCGCEQTLVAVLMSVGMFIMGFGYASIRVNNIDISPNFAGTTMGFINGFGALTGILTPIIMGAIIKEGGSLEEWRIGFWLNFAVLVGSVIPFLTLSSVKVQPWDKGD